MAAMTTTDTHWYNDHSILLSVAEHVADNTTDPHDVVYFMEKPWKYDAEAGEWATGILDSPGGQAQATIEDARRVLAETVG